MRLWFVGFIQIPLVDNCAPRGFWVHSGLFRGIVVEGPIGRWVHSGSFWCGLRSFGFLWIIPVGLVVAEFLQVQFIPVGLDVVPFIRVPLVNFGQPRGRWFYLRAFRLA